MPDDTQDSTTSPTLIASSSPTTNLPYPAYQKVGQPQPGDSAQMKADRLTVQKADSSIPNPRNLPSGKYGDPEHEDRVALGRLARARLAGVSDQETARKELFSESSPQQYQQRMKELSGRYGAHVTRLNYNRGTSRR